MSDNPGLIVEPIRLWTAAEFLADAKPRPWLIPGFIYSNGEAAIFAASGIGKTHVIVGMGHGIATGTHFAGIPATKGRVVAIVAEGAEGWPTRVKAWCDSHGLGVEDLADMRYVKGPVDFHTEKGREALTGPLEADGFTPDIIFVDTLSATAPPGFNINDPANMNELMHGVRELRGRYQCAAMIVTHEGWQGGRETGSSQFRNRLDTLLSLELTGSKTLKLSVVKDRDGAKRDPIFLEIVAHGDSVVLELTDKASSVTDAQRRLLEVLKKSATALKSKAWEAASGLKSSRFHAVRGELVRAQFVAQNQEDGYYPTTSGLRQLVQSGLRTDSVSTPHGDGASPSRELRTESGPLKGRSTEYGALLAFKALENRALCSLRDAGTAIQPREWQRRSAMDRSAFTGVKDGLEGQGLVVGKAGRWSLTQKGVAALPPVKLTADDLIVPEWTPDHSANGVGTWGTDPDQAGGR